MKYVKCNICKNEWPVSNEEQIEHWDDCEFCGENWWIEEPKNFYSQNKESLYLCQNRLKAGERIFK